jgi:hypothetical protein
MYERDRALPQKLVKSYTSTTTNQSGDNQSPVRRATTLYDLIQEFMPNKNGKGNFY